MSSDGSPAADGILSCCMNMERESEMPHEKKWTKQQEEEWEVFQSFREDYALPAGTIERSDRPDVVVNGDIKLGIELTSLHIEDGRNAASEQGQVKPRQRAVARAQEIHNNAGGRSIDLAIGFDPARPITNVEATSQGIAEVVAHVQLGSPGLVDELTYSHIDCLNFLYMSGEYVKPRWFVQQGYGVPMLQVSRVRQVVAEKIEKAGKYQSCDALWLLITVDFWNPAQDQEIEWPEEERIDCGPFERVLLYKPAYRRVVEILRG